MPDPDLTRFRQVVAGALAHLEANRQVVNDLNVFPVADGDTGDNMVLTLRAVLTELDRLAEDQTAEIDRDEIVSSVARAALLGARGNSGVILSQLIRGAAQELVSRPGELVDPTLVSAAMARAVDFAYESVANPVEGTILTVVREMASAVATKIAHLPNYRVDGDIAPEVQDDVIAEVLEWSLKAGDQSVKRTPEMLPALKEAGVIDAGGYAFTLLMAGVVAALRRQPPPQLKAPSAPVRLTRPAHNSSTYRYCINFVISGQELNADGLRKQLERLGDSIIVVGDNTTVKIHVHSDVPEQVTLTCEQKGSVSRLAVTDMYQQVDEHSERLQNSEGVARQQRQTGAMAVSHGGMNQLFEELGIVVLDGGPTLNPSTYELLAGISQVPSESVVLLPNSPNVIMAAERAAELSDKQVVVIPTASLQAGVAVGITFQADRSLTENVEAMQEARHGIRTGAVAQAAKDDHQGRFQKGDSVGFVDDELIAWGDTESALKEVISQIADDAELITCFADPNAPLAESKIKLLTSELEEFEYSEVSQVNYLYLLVAE